MTKRKNKKAGHDGRKSNSDENSLLLYLKEINQIPLLSKNEEEKIAKLAAIGDKAATERLINANLRFVVMVAKKYRGNGLPFEDLISEGNIGLLNAMKHFDAEMGYRFITYAVWWIRQAIIKAVNEKGRMIRLPSNKSNELALIEKTRQKIPYTSALKTDAEIREIAMFLDMAPEKASALMRIGQDVLSLDDPVSEKKNALTTKDYIEDEYINSPHEDAVNSNLREELETALNGLEKREAAVIRSRFGLDEDGPLTLKEIGLRYKLSRERVRQIEKRALRQLQQSSVCRKLESFIA